MTAGKGKDSLLRTPGFVEILSLQAVGSCGILNISLHDGKQRAERGTTPTPKECKKRRL